MSNKKDCMEKQKFLLPDGSLNSKHVQLTLVPPSPGTTPIVKSSASSKAQATSSAQAENDSVITSAEGRAIMSVLSQIEGRLEQLESDVDSVKSLVKEV